jgi:hypothetical protein
MSQETWPWNCESTKKCPKAVPTHFGSHVVLSRALKCSVKPYVLGPQLTLYPSCNHLLRWSLKHIVKQTCTSSAFPTNESTWSAMVMGPQSRVWSGPMVKGQRLHYGWRSRGRRFPPIRLQKTNKLVSIPFTIEAKVQMPSLSKIPTWYYFWPRRRTLQETLGQTRMGTQGWFTLWTMKSSHGRLSDVIGRWSRPGTTWV